MTLLHEAHCSIVHEAVSFVYKLALLHWLYSSSRFTCPSMLSLHLTLSQVQPIHI